MDSSINEHHNEIFLTEFPVLFIQLHSAKQKAWPVMSDNRTNDSYNSVLFKESQSKHLAVKSDSRTNDSNELGLFSESNKYRLRFFLMHQPL